MSELLTLFVVLAMLISITGIGLCSYSAYIDIKEYVESREGISLFFGIVWALVTGFALYNLVKFVTLLIEFM